MRGQEAEAISSYERALTLQPEDADALINLSLCLVEAGRLEDGARRASECARLHPTHAGAQRQHAHCLWRQGRGQLALSAAMSAHRLQGGDLDHQTAALLGDILRGSGDPDRAIPFLQRAVADQRASLAERRAYLFCLSFVVREAKRVQGGAADAVHQSLERSMELQEGRDASSSVAMLLDRALLRAICPRLSGGSTSEAVALAREAAAGADGSGAGKCIGPLCERALVEARIPGTDCLTHKAKLARLVAAMRADGDAVTPPTTLVHSMAELVEAMGGQGEAKVGEGAAGLWFLKQPHLQRGQGIKILASAAEGAQMLATAEAGSGEEARAALVLQRAVEPPALLNGAKFGLRVHLLLVSPPRTSDVPLPTSTDWPLVAWVHNDAVLTICGAPYNADRTDALTHITCTSVRPG